jgi:hypothetical protein
MERGGHRCFRLSHSKTTVSFRIADRPAGVSCSFLADDGRRYVCRTRRGAFTLSLASKYAGRPYPGKPEFISERVAALLFLKHVDSDGSGICFFVIRDTANFIALPLAARALGRAIRSWWWA